MQAAMKLPPIRRPVEMRPVPGWEGLYSVTRDGRVWAHSVKLFKHAADRPGRWLESQIDKKGYVRVWLRHPVTLKAAEGRQYPVHLLVLLAWGPPRPSPKHHPNHKDFDPSNNHVSNLDWMTVKENLEYSRAAGRMSPPPDNSDILRGRPKSAEHRAALSKAKTGQPSPRKGQPGRPSPFKGQSNLATKGSVWITDGDASRMIQPNDPIPVGWQRGRPWFTRRR